MPRSRRRRPRSTTKSPTASVSRAPARAADAPVRRCDQERGAGLIGTAFGVAIFLLFLLFAVQVLLGLYTTSVVTSTALDAANRLARAGDPTLDSRQRNEADRAISSLGGFALDGRATFEWTGTT